MDGQKKNQGIKVLDQNKNCYIYLLVMGFVKYGLLKSFSTISKTVGCRFKKYIYKTKYKMKIILLFYIFFIPSKIFKNYEQFALLAFKPTNKVL